MTIHEFDSVELLVALPDAPLAFPERNHEPLHPGDRGAVVHVHDDGVAFMVEFFRHGETVAMADVMPEQVCLSRQGRFLLFYGVCCTPPLLLPATHSGTNTVDLEMYSKGSEVHGN